MSSLRLTPKVVLGCGHSMIRSFSWILLAVCCGCRGSTIPTAPAPSPYFDEVASKLELGGELFVYADIDGDAERASDFLLRVVEDAPQLRGLGDSSRLHGASLARVLGLDQAKAIGLSSVTDGERYLNRGFVYAPERGGLLDVWGDTPRAFGLPTMAPADSDLIWEQQLDAEALLLVLRGLGELGIGMPPDELDAWLDSPLSSLDVTSRDVLEELKTTLGVILAIDETRNVWLPGQSFTFPHTEFVIAVDDIEPLADAVVRYVSRVPFMIAKQTNGWTIVSASIRLPAPWNAYAPALMKEHATGRTYLVSSPSFFQRCLDASGELTTQESFGEVAAGLPETGNGFVYLSSRMTRVMHSALDKVIAARGPAIQTEVARALLPKAGEPYASVLRNEPNGVLFRSNSTASHKSTLLTFGLAAVLPALVLLTNDPDPAPKPP